MSVTLWKLDLCEPEATDNKRTQKKGLPSIAPPHYPDSQTRNQGDDAALTAVSVGKNARQGQAS